MREQEVRGLGRGRGRGLGSGARARAGSLAVAPTLAWFMRLEKLGDANESCWRSNREQMAPKSGARIAWKA